jgi:hypothetical protein
LIAEKPRHYCRLPVCRTKLKSPVDNHHRAFCTAGCRASFYKRRCLVCERNLIGARRTICGNVECRREYRRWPHIYALDSQSSVRRKVDDSYIDKMGTKNALANDRRWRRIAGPALSATSFRLARLPIDRATADRAERFNVSVWNDAAAVKGAPINMLGGHRFRAAPRLDPAIRIAIISTECPVDDRPIEWRQPSDASLDVPDFLRRAA